MKTKKLRGRKCSAMLAAGAGAAVCLTGGGAAHAAFQFGNIAASNTGNQAFSYYGVAYLNAFDGLAKFSCRYSSFGRGSVGTARLNQLAGYLILHNAGVTVQEVMGNLWATGGGVATTSISDKYMAIKFESGGTKYGWIHIDSYVFEGLLTIDTWGYEDGGGTIKTLSDSVTANRLALSDGRTKLHWANDNEDGVARYEVQAKDASGEWQAVDSDAPGEGAYAAKVDGDGEYRLVVERVDGETEEIKF